MILYPVDTYMGGDVAGTALKDWGSLLDAKHNRRRCGFIAHWIVIILNRVLNSAYGSGKGIYGLTLQVPPTPSPFSNIYVEPQREAHHEFYRYNDP